MPVAVLGGREVAENKNKVLAFTNLDSIGYNTDRKRLLK